MEVLPTLSPLEDITISTSNLSVGPLIELAPQFKRLKIEGVNIADADHRSDAIAMVSAFGSIEQLDLSEASFGVDPDELALLSRLTSLKQLHLSNRDPMTSLSPLSALTQLEDLSVCADPDADWSPLSSMKKLRCLRQNGYVDEWNESSMRTLAALPELTSLIRPTKLSSSFPLPQVKEMEIWNESDDMLMLDAGCCMNVTELMVLGPVDVAGLVRCFPNLKNLEYFDRPPDIRLDPRPLAGLVQLERLSLNMHPSNRQWMTFLAGMDSIQHLTMESLDDVSVLRNMKKLRTLVLFSLASSKDISPLAELTQLRELNLEGTDVCSVACLRGHPSLVMLHLPEQANNQELMVDGEYALPNLKELWLGSKRV